MPDTKWLIPDATDSQDLSSAALSYTTTFARQFKLDKILFKVSVNITETITITLDSAKGSSYDTVLAKKTLIGQQDYVFTPEDDALFQSGDAIKIACTNANGTGTIYVKVKASELLR